MTEEFHRIRRLPPYVFAEVNAAKAKARAAAEDVVDLGMGNPDSPTPPHIVAKLIEAVQDPRTHRYSMSKGIPGLRKALAGYYARRFGVKLDPETEVVATLGSKEGLANLAQAISSPGDTILVDAELPETIAEGDRVFIGSAGAYSKSYVSAFNGFPSPYDVVIGG